MTPRRQCKGPGAVPALLAPGSFWSRIIRFTALLAAVAVTAGSALADDGDEAKDAPKGKRPSLSLKATPPVSFSPSRVVVTGELRGGSDTDPELYCPDVEWEWGDDTKSESKQNCEPFVAGESTLTRRWTASHTYTTAGRYQAYLRLKRGGKVIVAGSVKFDVRPGAGDLSDFDR